LPASGSPSTRVMLFAGEPPPSLVDVHDPDRGRRFLFLFLHLLGCVGRLRLPALVVVRPWRRFPPSIVPSETDAEGDVVSPARVGRWRGSPLQDGLGAMPAGGRPAGAGRQGGRKRSRAAGIVRRGSTLVLRGGGRPQQGARFGRQVWVARRALRYLGPAGRDRLQAVLQSVRKPGHACSSARPTYRSPSVRSSKVDAVSDARLGSEDQPPVGAIPGRGVEAELDSHLLAGVEDAGVR
jgi:hypothetical protein